MEQIISEFPKNQIDTAYFVDNYIKKWINKNLLLYSANINLNEKQKDLKKKTDDFYENLLIYKYQKKLVNQKIDTNINNNEVLEYYLRNKKIFVLKENIVKINFVSIKKNAPGLNNFKNIFFEQPNFDDISEYCSQYADKFFLSDTNWIYFNDILQHLPENNVFRKNYFTNIKNHIFEDSTKFYYMKIFDSRKIGEICPLNLVRDNIISTILNEKKLVFLSQLENQLYIQAKSSDKLKIYKWNKDYLLSF